MNVSPGETIFLHARELADPAEQRAYLDRECGERSALRDEVEAMLSAAAGAAEFFEEAEFREPTETAGSIIGRYKLPLISRHPLRPFSRRPAPGVLRMKPFTGPLSRGHLLRAPRLCCWRFSRILQPTRSRRRFWGRLINQPL